MLLEITFPSNASFPQAVSFPTERWIRACPTYLPNWIFCRKRDCFQHCRSRSRSDFSALHLFLPSTIGCYLRIWKTCRLRERFSLCMIEGEEKNRAVILVYLLIPAAEVILHCAVLLQLCMQQPGAYIPTRPDPFCRQKPCFAC